MVVGSRALRLRISFLKTTSAVRCLTVMVVGSRALRVPSRERRRMRRLKQERTRQHKVEEKK